MSRITNRTFYLFSLVALATLTFVILWYLSHKSPCCGDDCAVAHQHDELEIVQPEQNHDLQTQIAVENVTEVAAPVDAHPAAPADIK